MKIWNLFLLVGLLSFIACSDDEETDPPPTTPSIVEIATGDANFSTLVSALQRVDLVSTLEQDGPFTVFAPTNQAFTDLGVDLSTLTDAELTDILLYHVLGGVVKSTDLIEGSTYASTASTAGPNGTALSIGITKSGSSVTVNGGSAVTTADIDATNGVVHVIENVLLPLDIVGHASANESFSSLVGALAASPGDLVNLLSGDGPFTVFAPTNTAFADIQSTVDGLTPEQLQSVLTYHVIGGTNARSTDLVDGAALSTANGQDVTVDLGGPSLTDQSGGTSDIILTDVQCTNGVIHVLDRVLIPNL